MKTAEDAEDAEGKRLDEITGAVVDAAMKIHTALGPGLLESVYEKCLKPELSKRGLRVQSQVWLSGNRVGLLINFNVVHLRDGIKRLVNDRRSSARSTSTPENP
jgi:PD-(D/E)XK nuclease superfamily